MGNLLIVGLIAAWIVVLGPSVFRRRDERGPSSLDAARDRLAAIHLSRRGDHARDARNRHGLIGRSTQSVTPFNSSAVVGAPRRPSQTNPFAPPSLRNRHQRRRAQILQVLLGSCALSLALAVGTSVASLWLLQLGVDAVLVAYIALLRSVRSRGRGSRRVGQFASGPAIAAERSDLGSALVDVYDFDDFSEGDGLDGFDRLHYSDDSDDFDDFDDLQDLDYGFDDLDQRFDRQRRGVAAPTGRIDPRFAVKDRGRSRTSGRETHRTDRYEGRRAVNG